MPIALQPTFSAYRSALSGLERPLAFVDVQAMDANADWVEAETQGKPIRIGSKSIRSRELIGRLLSRGSRYVGVLAYSPREAAHLMRNGICDVVIAYPTMSRNGISEALSSARENNALLTFMCDDVVHLQLLDQVARELDVVADVAFDLDVSLDVPGLRFGVFRSPLQSQKSVERLVAALAHHRKLQLVGLMTYEAQLSGVPETSGGPMDLAIRALKARSHTVITQRRNELVRWVAVRHALRFVNAGGTGCLSFSANDASVTEVTAGSAYFAPALFDHYRDFKLRAAAFFALDVVRKANTKSATCFGGGYVASGEPGLLKVPVVAYPEGLRLSPFEAAGEVQTPLFGEGAGSLAPGDTVFFRHAKAGELSEHFNELALIDGSRLLGHAKTYRGEGLKF